MADWLGASFLSFYGAALLAVGYGLAGRWLPGAGPALRALAAGIVAASWLTLVFHGLLACALFDRVSAAIAMLAGLLGLRALGITPAELADTIASDARRFARLARPLVHGRARALAVAFGLLIVCTAGAALMLPPMAWDTLTYHYVKAALWVQTGGPIMLAAPGGWSFYAHRMPGGEIFAAWAMLPFGNDLVVGAVDVLFWGGIALGLSTASARSSAWLCDTGWPPSRTGSSSRPSGSPSAAATWTSR